MIYSKPELVAMCLKISQENNLDSALVCALIDHYSQWRSGYTAPGPSYHLGLAFENPMESDYRGTVWGLMGISGHFARSNGYSGPLPKLSDPQINLTQGCRILLELLKVKNDPIDALMRWNNDNNRQAVTAILGKIDPYRTLLSGKSLEQHAFQYDGKIPPQVATQIEENQVLPIP